MRGSTPKGWYRTRRLSDGVTLIWEAAIRPFYRCNIWHVEGRGRDLLIDTGMGIYGLRDEVEKLSPRPVLAIATHAHVDHIGAHHEFSGCAIHSKEADSLRAPDRHNTIAADYLTDEMFEGAPPPGFSAHTYCVKGARPTLTLEEGDVIDLGERAFKVMHLPGHSPGSIALWEEKTGILFSGDVVYDGPLIDDFHHSAPADYVESMLRLAEMPVDTVHAGHFPSFGRSRLRDLAKDYVEGRRAPGCPAGKNPGTH